MFTAFHFKKSTHSTPVTSFDVQVKSPPSLDQTDFPHSISVPYWTLSILVQLESLQPTPFSYNINLLDLLQPQLWYSSASQPVILSASPTKSDPDL